MDGADADQVRLRLRQLFELSEEDAARLFGGRPVIIKRGVDTAMASRFREVFREAGALVQVVPVGASGKSVSSADESGVDSHPASTESRSATPPGLYLAPAGDAQPLEAQSTAQPRKIDISHLSLVPGDDWTLADCTPHLPPIALPDIRHLSILVPRDESYDEDEDRKTF